MTETVKDLRGSSMVIGIKTVGEREALKGDK